MLAVKVRFKIPEKPWKKPFTNNAALLMSIFKK